MSWTLEAECRGKPIDLFFPEDGHMIPAAKQICDLCSVVDHCLNEALTFPAEHDVGIRAGMTQHKRRLLRATMRREPTRFPPYVPQAIEWDAEQERYISA